MNLREQTQRREAAELSPRACQAARTRGRAREEEECGIRTAFQRDVDRIVYSKAFRRLKHKTQVFLQPVPRSLPQQMLLPAYPLPRIPS